MKLATCNVNSLNVRLGPRIDHILLSPALAATCTACRIDRQARKGEKPSDHAPVFAELSS